MKDVIGRFLVRHAKSRSPLHRIGGAVWRQLGRWAGGVQPQGLRVTLEDLAAALDRGEKAHHIRRPVAEADADPPRRIGSQFDPSLHDGDGGLAGFQALRGRLDTHATCFLGRGDQPPWRCPFLAWTVQDFAPPAKTPSLALQFDGGIVCVPDRHALGTGDRDGQVRLAEPVGQQFIIFGSDPETSAAGPATGLGMLFISASVGRLIESSIAPPLAAEASSHTTVSRSASLPATALVGNRSASRRQV